jgi:hypothetical protein
VSVLRSHFGKEAHGLFDDQAFAFGTRQPFALSISALHVGTSIPY